MNHEPDEVLIARVAKGDADALDQLFRRHHGRVFALGVRLTGNRALADDVVQETFLRVLRHARGFRARASFRTWVYRIARNVCHDVARVARGAQRAETGVDWAAVQNEADARIDLLERALLQLPSKAREALVLRRFHDLSFEELGAVVGCSAAAARVRVHRALAELKSSAQELASNAE